MPKINITVSAEMPDKVSPEYKHKPLLEKVNDYIALCDSGESSEFHWKYLKCLYKKLKSAKRLNPELCKIMKCLTEFMIKHAGYDSGEDQVDIEAEDIFKYDKSGDY